MLNNSLWKYQTEIYFKAILLLEARWERFFIQMPTGVWDNTNCNGDNIKFS